MRGPIQTRRYGSLLRGIWGLGGGTTPGDEATNNPVQVSLNLEPDLEARPELGYPGGEILGAVGAVTVGAGGAGLRSKILLYNPGGSGMITVIERVLAQSAFQYQAAPGNLGYPTGYTAANNAYPRDTRLLSPYQSPLNLAAGAGLQVYTRNNQALVAGEDALFIGAAAGPFVTYDFKFVLKPTASLLIVAQADNVALTNVSIQFRSRPALQQELNA